MESVTQVMSIMCISQDSFAFKFIEISEMYLRNNFKNYFLIIAFSIWLHEIFCVQL